MGKDLTTSDYELLIEAVNFFDKVKTSPQFGAVLRNQVVLFGAVDRGESEQEVAKKIDRAVSETENEINELHEKCVLLQAKLIEAKSESIITNISGGLFGKEEQDKTDVPGKLDTGTAQGDQRTPPTSESEREVGS